MIDLEQAEKDMIYGQSDERCNCDECQADPTFACLMDCGECEGCQDAHEERRDIQYEIDCAMGKR